MSLIENYDTYSDLVQSQLNKGKLFDFESYKKEYKENGFLPSINKPERLVVLLEEPNLRKIPSRSFLEGIFPALREKRFKIEEGNKEIVKTIDLRNQEKIDEAQKKYSLDVEKYKLSLDDEKKKWIKKNKDLENDIKKYNQEIDDWKKRFLFKEEDAVVRFADEIIKLYRYGLTLILEKSIKYNYLNKRLIFDIYLENKNDTFSVGSFKYYKTKNQILPIKMKVTEMNERMKNLLIQLSISLTHLIFSNGGEIINEIFINFHSEGICLSSTSIDYVGYEKCDLNTIHGMTTFVRLYMRIFKQYNKGVIQFEN